MAQTAAQTAAAGSSRTSAATTTGAHSAWIAVRATDRAIAKSLAAFARTSQGVQAIPDRSTMIPRRGSARASGTEIAITNDTTANAGATKDRRATPAAVATAIAVGTPGAGMSAAAVIAKKPTALAPRSKSKMLRMCSCGTRAAPSGPGDPHGR